MFTITPPRCAFIAGITCLQRLKTPPRLTSTTLRNSDHGVSSIGPTVTIPATFASTSMRPCCVEQLADRAARRRPRRRRRRRAWRRRCAIRRRRLEHVEPEHRVAGRGEALGDRAADAARRPATRPRRALSDTEHRPRLRRATRAAGRAPPPAPPPRRPARASRRPLAAAAARMVLGPDADVVAGADRGGDDVHLRRVHDADRDRAVRAACSCGGRGTPRRSAATRSRPASRRTAS